MSKQVKSIRLNDELICAFTDYSNLLREMFGYTLSFGGVVSEALAEYLEKFSERWVGIMESQSVVDPLPNGRFKRYDFSEEQISRMDAIHKRALAMLKEEQTIKKSSLSLLDEVRSERAYDTQSITLDLSKTGIERLQWVVDQCDLSEDEVVDCALNLLGIYGNIDKFKYAINEY